MQMQNKPELTALLAQSLLNIGNGSNSVHYDPCELAVQVKGHYDPNPNPNPIPSPNQAPTVPLHEIALALRTMLGEIGEEDGAIILATIDPELGESPEDRPASLDEVLLAMMARPG